MYVMNKYIPLSKDRRVWCYNFLLHSIVIQLVRHNVCNILPSYLKSQLTDIYGVAS